MHVSLIQGGISLEIYNYNSPFARSVILIAAITQVIIFSRETVNGINCFQDVGVAARFPLAFDFYRIPRSLFTRSLYRGYVPLALRLLTCAPMHTWQTATDPPVFSSRFTLPTIFHTDICIILRTYLSFKRCVDRVKTDSIINEWTPLTFHANRPWHAQSKRKMQTIHQHF